MRRPSLLLAVAALSALAVASPLAVAPAAAADVIRVLPGDTLWSIAERHGISLGALVALNGIRDPNWIMAGQQIRLRRAPAVVRAPVRAARRTVHVVSPGETLSGIAQRYNRSIAALTAANGIRNASLIWVGMRVVIPAPPAVAAGRSGWE